MCQCKCRSLSLVLFFTPEGNACGSVGDIAYVIKYWSVWFSVFYYMLKYWKSKGQPLLYSNLLRRKGRTCELNLDRCVFLFGHILLGTRWLKSLPNHVNHSIVDYSFLFWVQSIIGLYWNTWIWICLLIGFGSNYTEVNKMSSFRILLSAHRCRILEKSATVRISHSS